MRTRHVAGADRIAPRRAARRQLGPCTQPLQDRRRRLLGRIELAFTLMISRYFFRERPTWAEITGLALLAVSIALVLNSGR